MDMPTGHGEHHGGHHGEHHSDGDNGFEYNISLSASLTDTDGSETLSDITIDNLPDGATLSGDNVTDNGDGTFTVSADADGNANVTLSSDTELSSDDLSGITSSVTSTTDGGDTATVEVTDDSISSIDGGDSGEFSFAHGEGHGFGFGDEMHLDFDSIDADNIDTLDLGEGDANHIDVSNLDINDVLNMTDEDNTLTILGDEGDTVSLDTDTWSQGDCVTDDDGNTFNTFTSTSTDGIDEIQLMIDSHVQVDC